MLAFEENQKKKANMQCNDNIERYEQPEYVSWHPNRRDKRQLIAICKFNIS